MNFVLKCLHSADYSRIMQEIANRHGYSWPNGDDSRSFDMNRMQIVKGIRFDTETKQMTLQRQKPDCEVLGAVGLSEFEARLNGFG